MPPEAKSMTVNALSHLPPLALREPEVSRRELVAEDPVRLGHSSAVNAVGGRVVARGGLSELLGHILLEGIERRFDVACDILSA